MKCPKCEEAMEGGILLDRGWTLSRQPMLWVEEAQVGFSTRADPDGPGQWEVDAYRCTGCGFVELYAGLPKDDA